MKIGVLGTGMVGQTIGTKLMELGHEVTMGSRKAGNENGPPGVLLSRQSSTQRAAMFAFVKMRSRD